MNKLAITINGTEINNGIPNLPTDGTSALSVILSTGVGLILLVAVLACLAFIIWGGVDWITAAGNKENIQKARSKILYAVIGLFIAFSAYFVMNVLSQFFGVEFFKVPNNSNAGNNSREDNCTSARGRCVSKISNCPPNWNEDSSLTCRSSLQKCCTGF